ncbi:MAG: hypothetical protein WC022_04485, partial [Parcubacteria group bacterium]
IVAVILIVIENKCSTWNIGSRNIKKILRMAKDQIVPRGTIKEALLESRSSHNTSLNNIIELQANGTELPGNTILCNDIDCLSMRNVRRYFQGILLGFIFIMLFDHYFWDIWQGQVLFWLVAGIVAGLDKK